VLGDAQSAVQDSFVTGLLDCPHYTRPEVYEGEAVPSVLMSGHHADIERWRRQQMLMRTWLRRPELMEKVILNQEDTKFLESFKRQQT
jgi:tRNA (guanine37-N1)-methyltransferase